MADLFASGRIIDVILVLVLLETLALMLLHQLTGRGPRPRTILPTLTSGLLLMVALRAALADLRWEFIALPLALALGAHLTDLLLRWRDD